MSSRARGGESWDSVMSIVPVVIARPSVKVIVVPMPKKASPLPTVGVGVIVVAIWVRILDVLLRLLQLLIGRTFRSCSRQILPQVRVRWRLRCFPHGHVRERRSGRQGFIYRVMGVGLTGLDQLRETRR